MEIEAIQHALVREETPSLARRRRITTFAAVGAIASVVAALRQTGAVSHLPDPPGRVFHSDEVLTSRPAYLFGIPDATLGAGAFGAIMALASAFGTGRSGRGELWNFAMGAAIAGTAAGAVFYLNEMRKEGRACAYCLTTAAMTFAMLPPAIREVRDAIDRTRMRGRGIALRRSL